MKKHVFFGSVVFGILLILPVITFAQLSTGSKRPFGAQIISITIPTILCAAQYGALTVRPVVTALPTPYFIRTTQRTVRPGSWILGWYNPIPDSSTCQTTSVPPVPVPSFEITY